MDGFAGSPALSQELAALEEQRAVADRSSYRKLLVAGPESRRWLNDLLTAAIGALAEGRASRSLLLSPTGRIRADVHVVSVSEGLMLLQDPAQPGPIIDLLAPYVLSSAVTLTDRTDDLSLYSAPGRAADLVGWGGTRTRPSVLGEGQDLLTPPAGAPGREPMMRNEGLLEVGDEALEVWRIRRGVPRFPQDLTAESVPAEAGLDHLIDVRKGCFLGQESVARIRNLGHPARLVLALHAEAQVAPGAAVLAGHVDVGRVTSAAPAAGGGTACLATVRWAAGGSPLSTGDGVPLARVAPSA